MSFPICRRNIKNIIQVLFTAGFHLVAGLLLVLMLMVLSSKYVHVDGPDSITELKTVCVFWC